jgi:hypothetical protein
MPTPKATKVLKRRHVSVEFSFPPSNPIFLRSRFLRPRFLRPRFLRPRFKKVSVRHRNDKAKNHRTERISIVFKRRHHTTKAQNHPNSYRFSSKAPTKKKESKKPKQKKKPNDERKKKIRK